MPTGVRPQGRCRQTTNNQFHRQLLRRAFVPLQGALEAERGEGNGEDRTWAHPGTAENTKHRKSRARNGDRDRDGSRSMTSRAKDRTETAAEMDAVRGMAMSSPRLEDWGG